jgi:hypothetical protein
MAGTAKQWLVGCGIGCGLMVALGLGLGAAGWYGVRHVAKRAETLEAASDSLATRFGPPEAWAPPLDGGLDPARIEAFLEARRLMAPERERTSNNLAVLDGSKGSSVPAKIAAGVDFVPRLLGFIEERDRALLQVDMGPGEYMYIYSVAYFGLLGKDPGDGPGFHLAGDGGEDRGHSWSFGKQGETGGRIEIGGPGDSGDSDGSGDEAKREGVRKQRVAEIRELLNRVQRENLRRQLAAVDASGDGAARASWRQALAAELAAMEADPARLAWEQGLPEPTRAALEPFRARLESGYDGMTGVLELGLNDRD